MTKELKEHNLTPMILTLIILAVVLFTAFAAGKDYYNAYTAKPSRVVFPPSETHAAQIKDDGTEVRFRKFFITVYGAKQVELLADFNKFGVEPIMLTPYSKGYFEVTLALAAGDYKYLFLVDGKETLDPSNNDIVEYGGRKVCVKTVR